MPALNQPQKRKIMIIAALAIICALATAFFQSIDSGRVYTHLFYYPGLHLVAEKRSNSRLIFGGNAVDSSPDSAPRSFNTK
ncbi:hypothetical protein COV49_00345 [Candidatus Falkowbacteria bacterium CG11_big_fil_rev_8_21_14_0_20_39_10]|uniref:Uncharacterized protein n=1 Tax=Candidatus Falkowbacteria bacterium CG11_big_fil_rev_8_21_14_0_20_39_10 TaxID=1974570 RepID=A0A2M6KAG6_9BACT|nr:MAG: hypothetical protein COV49_00345 [Candidatus Falkowbacteria bacterium CG11_big_fil_rev_8_21_14_0_20_39_10]